MSSESERKRLARIRWCECGQPWLPAAGMYGTTEERQCPQCTLRYMLRCRQSDDEAAIVAAHAALDDAGLEREGPASVDPGCDQVEALSLASRIRNLAFDRDELTGELRKALEREKDQAKARYDRRVCPCEFEQVEPCSATCTCRSVFHSGGCTRCCRYGSASQQVAAARRLALLHEALRKSHRLAEKRRQQLALQQQSNERRNRALDALHYVWCDGGCERGVHRWTDEEVTEQIVAEAERNTQRLRAWFENRKGKRRDRS